MIPSFGDELAQKLVKIPKPNFTCSFGALRLRAEKILVHIDPKLTRPIDQTQPNFVHIISGPLEV